MAESSYFATFADSCYVALSASVLALSANKILRVTDISALSASEKKLPKLYLQKLQKQDCRKLRVQLYNSILGC